MAYLQTINDEHFEVLTYNDFVASAQPSINEGLLCAIQR